MTWFFFPNLKVFFFCLFLPLEILAFRVNLSFVVEGSELGHQVCGVLGCVHSQRLGNDEEGTSKLRNGQLLSGTLKKKKKKEHNSVVNEFMDNFTLGSQRNVNLTMLVA